MTRVDDQTGLASILPATALTRLDALRREFHTRCLADATRLNAALDTATDPPSPVDAGVIGTIAHRMAGAAAAFEHHDLCDRAMRVEDLARGTTPDLHGLGDAIVALIETIRVLDQGTDRPSNG